MWPELDYYDEWKHGEIVPKKVEAKKEKDECECKFCIKCIGYAIVDVLVMFKGIIKKLR